MSEFHAEHIERDELQIVCLTRHTGNAEFAHVDALLSPRKHWRVRKHTAVDGFDAETDFEPDVALTLRTEHKGPVVGVFQRTWGGCHRPLRDGLLAAQGEEKQGCLCSHCGRFVYPTDRHNLAAPPWFHDSSQAEKA